MKSKSRIWEICFNASWPLDGCWEEHDRESQACEWNRTGDEWSYCLHFSFPFSQSMNCFIMIKDKTGINDTFTFAHQRETCLNLDESSGGSGLFPVFSAGERHLQDDIVATCFVCCARSWQMSLLGTWTLFVPTLACSSSHNMLLCVCYKSHRFVRSHLIRSECHVEYSRSVRYHLHAVVGSE